MSKSTLSTSFKDDVLASAMNGKRRYMEIQNTDGTVSFEDVTEYTQIGSTFGASQINEINRAVNNSFDASKIIDNYDTLLANTQSGYAAGALAVKQLKNNISSSSSGYKELVFFSSPNALNLNSHLRLYNSKTEYEYTIKNSGTFTICYSACGSNANYGVRYRLHVNGTGTDALNPTSGYTTLNSVKFVTATYTFSAGDVVKWKVYSPESQGQTIRGAILMYL